MGKKSESPPPLSSLPYTHTHKEKERSSTDLATIKTLLQKGRFAGAESSLRKIVKADPNNPEALILLGKVLMQRGKTKSAADALEHAVDILPDNPVALSALGTLRFAQHRHEESEAHFRAALTKTPDFTEALGNLGLVTQHLGKHDDALKYLGEAVNRGGANLKMAEALGMELLHQGIPDQARSVLSQVVKAQPDNAKARSLLGSALGDVGQTSAAESQWKQAEKADRKSIEPDVARARFYWTDGEIGKSISLMEKTLTRDPRHAATLFFWAHVADKNAAATMDRTVVIEMVLKALEDISISHEDRVRLGFAAGKLFDNDRQQTKAIEHYVRANRLIWLRQPMQAEAYRPVYENLSNLFNASFFSDHAAIVNRKPAHEDRCGEGLVFILGMPRSGTTLVEQIVHRRPGVYAGGERPDMDALSAQFMRETHGGADVTIDRVQSLAAQHHKHVSGITDGADRFTDKSPRNFMNLGLIACLFPRAKVIHCVRNPVDTCLSCYFNHFGYNSMKYSYDQEMLGFFYTQYRHMMHVWKETLPIHIHDAVYEDLVGNPESAIRALTDHCGFDWDDAFLKPEEGRRAVRTASLAQVTKPIYTDSVGRWAPYKDHIRPLLDALGPLPDASGMD